MLLVGSIVHGPFDRICRSLVRATCFFELPFDFGEEFTGRAFQSGSKREKRSQRWLMLAQFQHADVLALYIGLKGELFLGELRAKTVLAQHGAKDSHQLQNFSPSEMGELSIWRYNLSSQCTGN